jgi:hypothetical protein
MLETSGVGITGGGRATFSIADLFPNDLPFCFTSHFDWSHFYAF